MFSVVSTIYYPILLSASLVASQICSKGTQFHQRDNTYFKGTTVKKHFVSSILQCTQKCFATTKHCSGANFKKTKENGKHLCELAPTTGDVDSSLEESNDWIFLENILIPKVSLYCETPYGSCKEIFNKNPLAENGAYSVTVNNERFQVYCDMLNGGFTLIAKYSNADAKNWMKGSGEWWYDLKSAGSGLADPFTNADMLNHAFSVVKGSDIKVTRSDDVKHDALLVASNCIGGATMRQKITSYGNFRNSVQWTTANKCFGSCKATFSNGFETTKGFKFAGKPCNNTGDILKGGNIGFWCKYDEGDGAVIMIGGGGATCSRADHGIGITEENIARFGSTSLGYFDFGNDARPPNQVITENYALNLWIR